LFKLVFAVLTFTIFLPAADLFPLQTGNSWTYRDSTGRQSFTVTVGEAVTRQERLYYPLSGYTNDTLLVRLNDAQDLVYFDSSREREIPLTFLNPFEGGWWNAPGRPCDLMGQTLERRGTHTGPLAVRQVLEIRYRTFGCADTGISDEQYADNIGMVSRTVITIKGPVTYNLVQAHLGALTIDAGPIFGRFTVSVDDQPSAETLRVTLRIQTRPAAPLKLEFFSGQEFNIVLRDLNGNMVYNWAADKLFIQAAHERIVQGFWEETTEVPRPRDTGAYTVEAWLTTIGVPRFSATVPATTAPAN